MRKIIQLGLLLPLTAVFALSAQAGGQHDSGHGKPSKEMGEMDMGSMNMDTMDMSSMKVVPVEAGHGGMSMAGHAHASWSEPPATFDNKTFDQWDSYEQASKGMNLYRDNCMACHGVDGRGTGPLAKSLEHPPADLTNHFHMEQGKGDQYLFWRISEGGTVEPFVSMKSAMPAFKGVLNESERWSILSYVHQVFHRGFKGGAGMPGQH
ncbi:MAG: cytochrome c [Halopseudomonas sp.]